MEIKCKDINCSERNSCQHILDDICNKYNEKQQYLANRIHDYIVYSLDIENINLNDIKELSKDILRYLPKD